MVNIYNLCAEELTVLEKTKEKASVSKRERKV